MLIIGIDEAGRGPVIGPLVIVGFEIPEEKEEELRELGVKDSKLLSPARRKELFMELKRMGRIYVEEVPPAEIDVVNLNALELRRFRKILLASKADVAFIDAFAKDLASKLNVPGKKIIAEHKADKKYPVVSAASIVAKVLRDSAIERLREEYGDFGSGYPSDPKTVKFLKTYYRKYRRFPPFIRKSWTTAKEIAAGRQVAIIDFL